MLQKVGDDPVRYLEAKDEYDERIKSWYRRNMRTWYPTLLLTILPAALAVLILLYAFVKFLLDGINWSEIVEIPSPIWHQPAE